jgi:dUTP pyrophosphatase
MTEDQWRWANEYDARNRKLNGGNSMKLNGENMALRVKIKRLHPDAVIPKYAHEGDAGFDLVAVEDRIIEPGETKLIRTGLSFAIPPGYEMQIRPRSGITLKTKLRVQLGTIDSGYRGEIGVIVDNIRSLPLDEDNEVYLTSELETIDGDYVKRGIYADGTYIIRKGDRIAQGVIKPVEQAHFQVVDELDETGRGTGGFGSSGVKSKLDELLSKITPENRHEEIDM